MRSIERICLYVVLAVVAASLLGRAGADGDAPTTLADIQARSLSITNEAGRVVMRLSADKTGRGMLQLFTPSGKESVRLFTRGDDDGELRLLDDKGVIRTTVGANADGGYANFFSRKAELAAYIGGDSGKDGGYLAILGAAKNKVLEVYTHAKGGALALSNAEKRVATLGAAQDTGAGLLSVANPSGALGVAVFSSAAGGQIKALNDQGKTAAFVGVSAAPAGNGLVYVARDDGQRLAEIGRNGGRGGYMSIQNGSNKRVVFLGASTGTAPDDGVMEVSQRSGTLGVVLRGHEGGSFVQVYDAQGNAKNRMR